MANYDGQVVINTKLDDKGLKQGISGLQNTTIGALRKVKGVLATVGIGVGVVAAVKGVNNLIKSTAQLTDRIDKQSQKIGLSRRAYQEWDFILSQNGASVDGLQTSVKTLSTAVEEAANGNKTYQGYLDELKVSIYDTNGAVKNQETLFKEVFTALTKVESETKRTNLAAKLLGKSATELAPALNAGADSVDELRDRAYELNLVLDDATVNIGVRLTDTLDKMRRSMQSASARAIAPLMGQVDGMADSFTKNAIPAIEKFISTAFKIALATVPIFEYMRDVVAAVMEEIGVALDGPWKILKGFINDLINLPVVQNTIQLAIDLAGELWASLKKGAQTGDWGDFWKAAVGAAQFTIGIVATISLAQMSAAALWGIIQTSLAGAGFSKVGLVGGAIAMLSVGLAVKEAMDSGDYSNLANNMVAALLAGFAVAGLTGSAQAGVLTFTAVLNLKVGEIIAGGIDSLLKPYKGNDQELLKIQDIIAATEGLLTRYGATGAARKKLIEIWGIDTGRQVIAGLGVGLADIDKMGEDSARTLLYAVRDELGIQSPSREFKKIGEDVVAGLDSGLEGMAGAGKKSAAEFLETAKDVLGVHSESTEGRKIGQEFVNGIISGVNSVYPKLEKSGEKLLNALTGIFGWDGAGASGAGSAGIDGLEARYWETPSRTPAPTFGSQSGAIWGQVMDGWKQARSNMSEEISDWTSWAANQFMQIGPSFGNAIGAGMRSLGQSIANQKEIIEELGQSILEIEDRLSDAYEDLEDAQKAYSRAVLSGDSTAIKNAEKRVKQQEKLVKGHEEQLKALKEEKKSIEDGSKSWKDFAKTVLGALSDTLYGLGAELAGRAIIAALTFNGVGALLAGAGSVAAFGAAITLDSWAGSFAQGGIVPSVSGVPSSGDRHIASVNPGELILNQAQQSAIAAQLAMFARITDLLSSLQFSSHGGINIYMAGATINGLNEEAVGKAIYRNIKTLQSEGVLRAW